ncbi:MAG: hypothetical protein KatS3mg082_0836 [Nitrospiraceae bacterium]|nr:MAG: hypothetical protein KatS3mg082_0836 [Nitrospiraceae bacterium]
MRDLAEKAGEAFEEAVEKGRDFVEAKKSVLKEAFEAGREAMKRERDRLSGQTQS